MRLALSCECGEIEQFLGQYSHFGAPVKDLSRFEALCHKLGDPQDNLRYIHIVGTNGKGSVAEFCAGIHRGEIHLALCPQRMRAHSDRLPRRAV